MEKFEIELKLNENNILVVSSVEVAKNLGVEHKSLLRKIDDYIKKFSSAQLCAQFYISSEYKDKSGKSNRNYLITKKGIAQLVGGYSSAVEKAFELNVAYINRFEEMENQLKDTTDKTDSYMILDPIERAKRWIEEQKEKMQLESKVNRLVHSSKLYTATEIAKELGFKSATALNKELEARKIQYKMNGTWVLSARYSEAGYTSIKQNELENGTIIYDRKWTGLGRDFLIGLFNN